MNPLSAQTRDQKPIELVVVDDVEATISPAMTGADDNPNSVRPSPQLSHRNTLSARRGENVTMECIMISGVGRATSAVRWEKYGSVLPPMEKRKYVFGNLILLNVTKDDEGTYICRGDARFPSAAQSRYIMYTLRVYGKHFLKILEDRGVGMSFLERVE